MIALDGVSSPSKLAVAEPLEARKSDPSSAVPKDQAALHENEGDQSCVLKLKGLPYSAGEGAIREFFAGFTIKEVAFVYEPDGRPSGLAFAEFATRDEALQAMSKNGAYIGERYVRLLHVPKQEMLEQVRLGTIAIPGNAHRRSKFQQHGSHVRSSFDHMQQQHSAYGMVDHLQVPHGAVLQAGPPRMMEAHQGYPHGMPQGPPGAAPVQMVAAAGPNGAGGAAMVAMAPGQMGQLVQVGPGGMAAMQMGPGSAMPAMAQMVSPDGMPVAMANTHMGMQQMQMAPPHVALAYQLGNMSLSGPHPSHGAGGMPQHMQQQPGPQQQQQQGQQRYQQQQQPIMMAPAAMAQGAAYAPAGIQTSANASQQQQQQPVIVIGTESKTVKIRGLPFRATPLDIFNFFEGYDHIVESLQLGVDALGRPSGEAWLTFTSAEEALRAVRERNRHYLGNRYLELSLT